MAKQGSNWFFVDVEARGASPVRGTMTEFGVVHFTSRETFHGVLYESTPDPANPAIPLVGQRVAPVMEVAMALTAWLDRMLYEAHICDLRWSNRKTMWSDNPAYDFMWIAGMFDQADLANPFGYSARRISDFYAGLAGKVDNTQQWKRWRKTIHDHNPVHDALGNAEAMDKILEM